MSVAARQTQAKTKYATTLLCSMCLLATLIVVLQDTDTSDSREMLGDLAYKHLLSADKFEFIQSGDTEVDSVGTRYRERFCARDIDWFKRVMKAFRVSLGYSTEEITQMMAVLTAILHLGNVDFHDDDDSAAIRNGIFNKF